MHKNIPTMLGKITGTIADANLNIQNMLNKSKNDYAYTLIDVQRGFDENPLIKKLFDFEGIIGVRVISAMENKNAYQDGKLVIGRNE